jgi:hypothetical protein
MKLWELSQTINEAYEAYDGVIVAAETENDAREIFPTKTSEQRNWCQPGDVVVKYLGEAAPGIDAGVVMTSMGNF